MKRSMIARLLAAVLAAFLAGCAAHVSLDAPPPPGAASLFTTDERAFVTQAAATGLYEVQAGRLATDRAVHPGVRTYAQALVTDHMQANGELDALLRAKGMAPLSALPPEFASKFDELAGLRAGPEFDRGFVRGPGARDHAAAIALFERGRAQSVDRDLRAWIDRMLPALRTHLAQAQMLAAVLGP